MTERWGGEPTEPIPGYGRGYGDQAGGEPTQMLPPNRRPTGPAGPDDRQRRRRQLWLMAAGVLAIVIIVVLLIVLITSSGGNSSNAVSISSFNVPTTVTCSGPTTIGVSWTTTNATQVVLSIDGTVPYKTYPGATGADTVPFACNGVPHRYTITAKSGTNGQATQTQTVTPLAPPTTPATKPPPTSTSTSTSTSTTTTTSP